MTIESQAPPGKIPCYGCHRYVRPNHPEDHSDHCQYSGIPQTLPPELDDHPTPVWQKLAGIVALVALVAVVVVFRGRISADFWPPDASRVAPNLLASLIQYAILLVAAALLYPPFRRAIHRFVSKHTAPLHAQFDRLHEQRERHHRESMEKMDAMHEHLKRQLPETVRRVDGEV